MSNQVSRTLCALSLVAACSGEQTDSSSALLAGETARAYGIDRYEITDDGARIALVGGDGVWLGEIAIAATDVIEGEGEDAIHANRMVTFHDHAGSDAPGRLLVAAPTPVPLEVDMASMWEAALTDPALADAFAGSQLAFAARATPGELAQYGCSYAYSQECGGAYYCNQADAGGGAEWQVINFSMCAWENCEAQDKQTTRYCHPSCVGGPPSPCGAPYGSRGCYVTHTWLFGNRTCSDYGGSCSQACQLF